MKLKVKGMNKSAGVQKREAQEKEKWAHVQARLDLRISVNKLRMLAQLLPTSSI
jgi:hypothetical protein